MDDHHDFYECRVCQDVYMACLGWRMPVCLLCDRQHWQFERCADVTDRPTMKETT